MAHQPNQLDIPRAAKPQGIPSPLRSRTPPIPRIEYQPKTPALGVMVAVCPKSPKPLARAIWDIPEDMCEEGFVRVKAPKAIADSESLASDPDSSNECDSSTDNSSLDSITASETELISEKLCNKWLGTSVLGDPEWSQMQSKIDLERLVSEKVAAEATIQQNPYDPETWLKLSYVYFDLCYSDLQVSTAYKALMLVKDGLNLGDHHFRQKVRAAVSRRLSCGFVTVLNHELEYHHLEASKAVLRGLLDCDAYWDGLIEAKNALRIFPGDEQLLCLQGLLKEGFRLKTTYLQECKSAANNAKFLSRMGRVYKRQYPWLEAKLFDRTPKLLKDFNAELNTPNCEIRQADFGGGLQNLEETDDVGPLGVFAIRDIQKDEALLIDHNITLISNIPSSKMQNCDACHASLSPLHVHPSDVRYPKCCQDVAYCSDICRNAALGGYHKVLCGKDFNWLYKNAAGTDLDVNWRPLMLLRVFAIVLADQRSATESKPVHPLQHPLLARLTAGYSSSGNAQEQEWNYFTHVVGPAKILTQLGIDVFTSNEWTPEVIHTIYWRIINNACKSSSITVVDGKVEKCVLMGISPGYIFFNHSCDPSVTWTAMGCLEALVPEGQKGKPAREGEWTGVGNSAMLCVAMRDIKKGDEARISYIPAGKESKAQLARWFEGGCGCGACDAGATA